MGTLRAALLLVLLGAAPARESLVLVSGGATTYEIVRPEKAPQAVQVAVRELGHFIERSTGVRLPVATAPTPGKDHLFVGGRIEGLKPEGFRIHAAGRDLHIAGDDSPGDPEQIRRNRPTRCGTLFGVYEFLERYLSVVFAWHDDLGTIVPSRKEIRIPLPAEIVQAPDWATRTIIHSPAGATGGLFGRRLRLGASMETDYTHAWFRILPPEKHGAAHPEYFALVGGERKTSTYLKSHGGQVCTTNPEVIDLFARAAIDHFDRSPGDEVFALSPNDGKGFCECAPCRALDPPGDGDPPDLTDRILTFYNAVAERVARVHPSKRLGGFVYAAYRHAPARVRPHPSLSLAHATNSAHAQGMGDAREREDERAWVSLSKDVVKYDIYYYGEYGSMNLPAPITTHLAEKLRREHELGFRGAYLYAAPSYELLGAGHYLMARLMWDRKADGEALERRYHDALYGPAGPDALEYTRLLESRLRKARLEGIDRGDPILLPLLGASGDDETSAAFTVAAYGAILEAASKILDRARSRALSDSERERLARLQDHHDLLSGTVRAIVAAGREDLEAFRAALELREAARARIRPYAPTLSADLDADDGGRLAWLSPKGALARLAREGAKPTGRAAAKCGFEELSDGDLEVKLRAATSGGARVALVSGRAFGGRQSLRVSVPAGGEASVTLDAEVAAGGLYRLTLAHRASGVRPRYDHTREAPLVRFQGRSRKASAAFPRLGVPAIADSKEWRTFRSVLQFPPGAGSVRMTLSFPLPGEFEIDDVHLEELR